MKKIEWTPSLAVGIDSIDKQHQELFRRIGDLLDACNEGHGQEAISEVLRFLENYVADHFGNEEKLMEKYQYPDTMFHKGQHVAFIDKFTELKTKLEANGPSVPLVVGINIHVVKWLNDHILRVDRLLGRFLQEKGVS
ncbi:MAG: hemerythrin [Alphaproteobacteria bacterium CG_4_10_14_0_2_um_filter_63_37]|nr:MAG: hemerythrin [Proteobacteria bacterium CG1_02_64_396]PJA25255.1 MAG: hemerythrin [Alphaproteobacteria bacterium CG_4_10_14_0_2_um_filter_63_37]